MLSHKSSENILSAELLLTNKIYNSIPHCAYYACFQLICHINGNKQKPANGQGSHEEIIKVIYNDLKSDDKKSKCNFKFNLTPNKVKDKIYKLKELRSIADYNDELIDSEIASNCIEESKSIITILNYFYNPQ